MDGFPVPTIVGAAHEGSADAGSAFEEHTSKKAEMMHTKAASGHSELHSSSPKTIIFSYRDHEKATSE